MFLVENWLMWKAGGLGLDKVKTRVSMMAMRTARLKRMARTHLRRGLMELFCGAWVRKRSAKSAFSGGGTR